MTISELKLDLMKKIIATNNIDLLLKIKKILKSETNSRKMVSEVNGQIRNGKFISDEQAEID